MGQETNATSMQESVTEDTIDIIALVKTVWNSRKVVIKTTLIFMAIGLLLAIFTPKQYTASTTIVPSIQGERTGGGGGLSSLAALAGVNLSDGLGGSEISPTLYPEITSSITFQKELLQTPLHFEGQKAPISYEDYYTNYHSPGLLSTLKKYTLGLPGLIIGAFKTGSVSDTLSGVQDPNIVIVSLEEEQLIKQLEEQLSLVVNDKEGYISLSVNMPEALAAAELAQKAQVLLQEYVIGFKIQKSSEELSYISERYGEKEKEFRSIQQQLARYRDRNQNLSSAMSQTRLEALRSEYSLALNVYSELATQLEAQKLQVKKDTPVFTILKPVSVPIKKSTPNRPLILLIWTFLGMVISIAMVLGKPVFVKLKEDFASKT